MSTTRVLVETETSEELLLMMPNTTNLLTNCNSNINSNKRLRNSYVIVEEDDDEEEENSSCDGQEEEENENDNDNENELSNHSFNNNAQCMASGGGGHEYASGLDLNADNSAELNAYEASQKSLKVDNSRRRYPCGFTGCNWVFTRSNHVLRHHQRVHPGFSPTDKEQHPQSVQVGSGGGGMTMAAKQEMSRSLNVRDNPSSFFCDFPGCSQQFKTLTLLTRHKRYVHLMIAIHEQMSYIAQSNGMLDPAPRTYTCDMASCGKVFFRKDHLHRHLIQSHNKIVRSQLQLALREVEERDCDEPIMSELEPEVLLRVDETKVWAPSGAIDIRSYNNTHNIEDARGDEDDYDDQDQDQDQDEMEDEESDGFHSQYNSGGIVQVNAVSGSESLDLSLKPKRPYVCEVPGCDKSYTKHSHLVRHKVETHKMQKPEPKQRGAGTNGNFIPPPPLNLADRPYVCDFPGCRWSFKRQYHLDRHFMTHRLPSMRGQDGQEGEEGDMSAYLDARYSDDEMDGAALSSPNIVTSTKSAKGDLNGLQESKGTSLLSPLPSSMSSMSSMLSLSAAMAAGSHARLSDVSVVPTKFNWPQLVKDKLFMCIVPSCGMRFKSQLTADQHYVMTHSGQQEKEHGHKDTHSTKCPPKDAQKSSTFSSSPSSHFSSSSSSSLYKFGNQVQVMPMLNSSSLGRPSAASTPEVSLLKKPRLAPPQDLQHQTLPFSQLMLLQAALTKGSGGGHAKANTNATSTANTNTNFNSGSGSSHIVATVTNAVTCNFDEHERERERERENGDEFISASNDSFTEDEKELLLRNWAGKQGQKKTREKGIFPCDIPGCDKKFGRNCELTRHKLNHMDVWPFSCDWPGCGRKFKRKDVFKNHQRTHRKEDGDEYDESQADHTRNQDESQGGLMERGNQLENGEVEYVDDGDEGQEYDQDEDEMMLGAHYTGQGVEDEDEDEEGEGEEASEEISK